MSDRYTEAMKILEGIEKTPSSSLSSAEIARRRESLVLGQELNRIQGAEPSPITSRLMELWVTGQVSREDVSCVAADLARRGLLSAKPQMADERR